MEGEHFTMTITQIKYYIIVAQHCNMRKAASELFVSQQVLSKQIKALETEIGVELFERRKQRISLTEAGKYMYSVWVPLLNQTEAAIEYVRKMKPRQNIRIGVPDISGITEMVIELLESDYLKQQNCEFEIISGTMNKLMELFTKNSFDLLLFFYVDLQYISCKYYYEKLRSLQFGVVMSRKHRLAKHSNLNLIDLKQEKICMFDDSYARNVEKGLLSECKKAGLTPKAVQTVQDWKNMELTLSLGNSVALTYRCYLPLDSNRLVFIPIEREHLSCDTDLVIVWKDNQYLELIHRFKEAFEQK